MASETKVALVVGLAFIICFAAILTRRGGAPRINGARTDGLRVDLGTVAGGSVKDTAARLASRAKDAAGGVVPALASGASEFITETGHLLNLPGGGSGGRSSPGRTPDGPAAEKDPAAKSQLERLLDEEARRRNGGARAKESGGEATPVSASATPPADAAEAADSRSGRVVLASHTVSKGETLSKIAQRHYGDRWKQGMDSILAANGGTIRHPDEIREGVRLELPRLAASSGPAPAVTGAAPQRADAPATRHAGDPVMLKASSASNPVASAPPAKPTSYELKAGDTYMSIARTVLGDEKRWKEIHELNKDKIAQPTAARAGQTILLPPVAGAKRVSTEGKGDKPAAPRRASAT